MAGGDESLVMPDSQEALAVGRDRRLTLLPARRPEAKGADRTITQNLRIDVGSCEEDEEERGNQGPGHARIIPLPSRDGTLMC